MSAIVFRNRSFLRRVFSSNGDARVASSVSVVRSVQSLNFIRLTHRDCRVSSLSSVLIVNILTSVLQLVGLIIVLVILPLGSG